MGRPLAKNGLIRYQTRHDRDKKNALFDNLLNRDIGSSFYLQKKLLGRPFLQAGLLPDDLNTIPNICVRENSL